MKSKLDLSSKNSSHSSIVHDVDKLNEEKKKSHHQQHMASSHTLVQRDVCFTAGFIHTAALHGQPNVFAATCHASL